MQRKGFRPTYRPSPLTPNLCNRTILAWFNHMPKPRIKGIGKDRHGQLRNQKLDWQVVFVVAKVTDDEQVIRIEACDLPSDTPYTTHAKFLTRRVSELFNQNPEFNVYGWLAAPNQVMDLADEGLIETVLEGSKL